MCSSDDDDSNTSLAESPIHQKWVKAQELVDAEQHGEILHPSSRIHPRNGCFKNAPAMGLGHSLKMHLPRLNTL